MIDRKTDVSPKQDHKPIWPKIPAGFVRAVLAGHSALGLAFAALIYLVCFSGTVAVFIQDFQRWERPDAPRVERLTPEALQQTLVQATQRAPGVIEHLFVTPPSAALPRTLVRIETESGEHMNWFADREGALVTRGETPFSDFMRDLHVNLHLPQTWGLFIVGLTGVALLSSLISGVLAHPRVFRDAFHLRWGGSRRLQEADLHNRLGVWGLPFHILVSLTGALLGLTTVIVGVLALVVFKGDIQKAYALFLPPTPIEDVRTAPLPDLAASLTALRRLDPAYEPTFVGIEHPHERGQSVMIVARDPGARRLAQGDIFTFDGRGHVTYALRTEQASTGRKIMAALPTLHFGWFGGWLVKIAYAVLGFGLTTVTSSGVSIWLARRRDKGRPAPRWERVWTSVVWGQPFAYAAAALVAVGSPGLAGIDAPLMVWLAAAALALGSALFLSQRAMSTALKTAAALLIVLTCLTHLAAHGAAYPDTTVWIVQAGLLALAAWIASGPLKVLIERRWPAGV